MIKRHVIRRYHSIYGSWKSIIPTIRGDVMILSTRVAIRRRIVHDMFLNRTCGVLVYQPNVTLALTSKTEASPNEGRIEARLAQDDATLQSQSR